ncbi:MAG: helicase [Bacteroidales bacterium]|nr:helicase [Bacteroidales bacterium]
MSTKFFNNIDTPLLDKFHGIASNMLGFEVFHAVVGYFRSSGYFRLRQELDGVSEIRILVGINIDDMFHKAQAADRIFYGDTEQSLEQYAEWFLSDVSQSDYSAEVDQGIRQFCTDIASNRLQLRIHPSRNLHAKFYPCLPKQHNESSDGWVIMGSSNLSEQGLGISEPPRHELNVAMKDYDDVAYCEEQFQLLWKDALPVSPDDLLRMMNQTHLAPPEHQPTPYELYMRMLIDHFETQVEDDFVPHLPDGYTDLAYQRDAVVQAYDIMLRHGGCFIADVVGLGKTVVAAMIAQRFIHNNGADTRILVIFPPAVRSNWEETFNNFKIKNKYSRFVTRGNLDKVVNGRDNYDKPEYYDLIIVDEAHNFRHDSTDSYDLLQRICKSERKNRGNIGGQKRVLLLSATPINNTPEDIKNQLLLFQDTARCTIDGVNNIADTFAPWIREHKNMMSQRSNLSPDDIARRSDEINQQLRHTVLEKVMVRRTRSNIMHEPRYANEIKFPKLLDPEAHTYHMSPILFWDTFKKLIDTPDSADMPAGYDGSGLRYARYRAIEFCLKRDISSQKRQQMAEQLAGLYKVHMVKRLESSVEAFRKSLLTLRNSTQELIKMLDNNRVVIIPDLNVSKLQAEGWELDEIIERATSKGHSESEITYAAADFAPEFREMLEYDAKLLENLCQQWEKVKTDPKLDKFIDLLQNQLFCPKHNPSGKLVVFSESVDTVHYLERELKARLNRTDIVAVCSLNRNKQRDIIRTNFDANHKDEQRNDYNIIITSDVLAEGVNLHRANVIVNYDSPWNATRQMQLIGRVNRIGSTAEAIHNHMFYPSDPGDEMIALKKNSLIKLQAFHSALGEDTKIYSHDEIVREFRLFNSDVRDDTDRNLELLREVRTLHDKDPQRYQRIKNLPHKSRCARSMAYLNATKPKTSEHLSAPTHSALTHPQTIAYLSSPHKKAFYQVGDTVRELSFLEAASIFCAEPSEKPVPIESSKPLHYEQVRRAMQRYTADQQQLHTADEPRIGGKDSDAKMAAAFLRELRPSIDDAGKRTIDSLKQMVERGTYNQLADAIVRLSQKHKKQPLKPIALIEQLDELAQRYSLPKQPEKNTTIANIKADIILSETFVNQ